MAGTKSNINSIYQQPAQTTDNFGLLLKVLLLKNCFVVYKTEKITTLYLNVII